MWIAEAEGVGREEFATEDEALAAAEALGTKGFHWEMRESRENAAQGDAGGQVDPNYTSGIPGRERRFSGRDNQNEGDS